MTTNAIIREISELPLTEKLLLVEKTLKGIRQEKELALDKAVQALHNDYKSDNDLIAFTKLDAASFYETK